VRLGYYFGETATNLRRNLLMTVAAISTVAISLLLLGGVQILGIVVNNVTGTWEAKVEVSAFLVKDISEEEQQELIAQVNAMPEVDNVTYVSPPEALEEFKKAFPDKPELWRNIEPTGEHSLPASLRIKLVNADDHELVAEAISDSQVVDDVRSGGEIIRRLLQVNSLLRTITFVMSIILLIAAGALIANTIRLAVYARREEIGIMKLVGATNWFIRIPFMLEGLFAALVGAAVAGGIVLLSHSLLFSRLANSEEFPFLQSVFNFSTGDIGGVLILLAAVGALVGLIGSTFALRRFLEV
jgi:cell division transport system permease protein